MAAALSVVLGGAIAAPAAANGIYRNGIGARAMALGGADVAWAEDALGAMAGNPASLGFLGATRLDLSLTGLTGDGEFTNPANRDGRLIDAYGVIPDGAFSTRLGPWPVTVGLSIIPESALTADWRYNDTPGGTGGVTYGRQQHRSSILVLRSALGLGVELTPALSLGGSLGLVYNENSLTAPYIFQTHPQLKGFKTLLDLETSGFGWNGSVGVLYRAHETLQLGVSYTSDTRIDSTGRATGDLDAQFAALEVPFQRTFRYDAAVETHFPQMVKAGLSWKPLERWRVALQVDWINWGGAFDELPITLTNGSNADVNGFVGSSTIQDTPPLRWRDRFVYRLGIEHALTEQFVLRAGYAYGDSPVPDGTLTPLTAVIMEHTVSAGIGYRRGRVRVDLAYQYDIPVSRRVGTSDLAGGEYSNSRTELSLHWLAVSTSVEF